MELALVLPVVVTLLLVVVQVGLVVRTQVLVSHAAREGARAAAVSPTLGVARRAALDAGGLAPERLSVSLHRRGTAGGLVAVTVRYRVAGGVPIVGRVVAGRELTATVVMRVET